MSETKWVHNVIAEDDDYNFIEINEDDEGLKFFKVYLSNHRLTISMFEEDLKALYALLKQAFECEEVK